MVRNGGNLAVSSELSTYVTNKSKVPNPQTANDRVFLPQSTVSLSPTRDSHTYFITLRACTASQRLTVYYIRYICDVHSASALATKCVGTKRVFPSVRVPLQPSHNPRYGHNAGAVSVSVRRPTGFRRLSGGIAARRTTTFMHRLVLASGLLAGGAPLEHSARCTRLDYGLRERLSPRA